MPELPEVETVKRGLNTLLVGHVIKKVIHDTPKSFPNAPTDVEQFLINAEVTAVRRRAKVLLIDLSSKYSLVIHLKMTGQLVYVKAPNCKDQTTNNIQNIQIQSLKQANSVRSANASISKNAKLGEGSAKRLEDELRFGAGHPSESLVGKLPDRSTRVEFDLDSGAKLFFNDQRKFGWVRLLPTIEIPNIDFMKKVGPEPLEKSFTDKEFIQRLERRKNTTIKAAILDQTVLAGIGNIYADESLWAAQIHPSIRVKDVPTKKLKKLFTEIRTILELAIEKGGSTDKNYVNAEGKEGSYLSFAHVFRREGKPCLRHPEVKIEKIRVAGRGTHICPLCQVLV